MATIKLENICKVYPNGVNAVDHFDLEIKDREFVIFVGPSGCGKSTTLRMIAGLEDITSGTIKIDDQIVNDVPAKNRDIAMVFQSYALYPHMSVYDNIAFGIRKRKQSKAELDETVKAAARILDLESQLKKKPKELSGGQKQRVAMGASIVREPKVFLMDEPLSNLDAKLRVQMRLEIAQLHERLGATIVYVTHDQTEAMTLGSKIVVMKDGVIQQVDTPENLYKRPVNLFVAGFIGSPQMNFLKVQVHESGEDLYLQLGNSKLALPLSRQKILRGQGYLNKEVILGIRPEDISDSEILINTFPNAVLPVKIEVYELLGAEAILYFEYAGNKVTASVHSRTRARSGDQIKMVFDMEKSYLFDIDTEQAIL